MRLVLFHLLLLFPSALFAQTVWGGAALSSPQTVGGAVGIRQQWTRLAITGEGGLDKDAGYWFAVASTPIHRRVWIGGGAQGLYLKKHSPQYGTQFDVEVVLAKNWVLVLRQEKPRLTAARLVYFAPLSSRWLLRGHLDWRGKNGVTINVGLGRKM